MILAPGDTSFQLVLPEKPGHYQLVVELLNEENKPVRSWRDIELTY